MCEEEGSGEEWKADAEEGEAVGEMSGDSAALVEDLFRELASGSGRFDPETLVSDAALRTRHKKSKHKHRHKSAHRKSKHKKRRHGSESSTSRSSDSDSERKRSRSGRSGRKLRMDKEEERQKSSRPTGTIETEKRKKEAGPVRASSPVFQRTDISNFIEDAKSRIAKGFEDRVGENSTQELHAPITQVKATSLSEYLRKKGHEVPATLAEIEKEKQEEEPKPEPEPQPQTSSAEDAKSEDVKAEEASLKEIKEERKSFPLSKNGDEMAKNKAAPVKNSKAFLPRNMKIPPKKDDYQGPNPPPRARKEVEEEEEEDDLVGKPLPLKAPTKATKATIAIKVASVPAKSEAAQPDKSKTGPVGAEDGEIAESDHGGHSSDMSIDDPHTDGELKEEEDTKPPVKQAKEAEKHSKRAKDRKRRRRRSSSRDSSDSRDERRHRKSSRRKEKKKRRKRSRSKSRSESKRRDEKESWAWGTGETRSRRRRGPAGFSRERAMSRSPSRSSSDSDGEPKIDKKKLFEIARRNASKMLAAGTLQEIRKMSQTEVAALQAGGKSVEELVEYCKRLQKKERNKAEAGEGGESTDSESAAKPDEDDLDFTIHHPYVLAQKAGIVLNIPNSTPLPVNQLTTAQRAYREAQLRTEFPVSSGKQHAITGPEWTPVEKDEKKAIAAPLERKAITYTSSAPSTSAAPAQPLPLPPPPPPPPPAQVFIPPPGGISAIVTRRSDAQKRLATNPSDAEAIAIVEECDQQMRQWAESKNLPGAFSGSTGVNCLTPEELAPRDKRFQAWVTRDQLKKASAVESKVGLNLLLKMGWHPGEGLGKGRAGPVEPLVLDIKSDRKGLLAPEEAPRPPAALFAAKAIRRAPPDIGGKNPISALTELCAKRRWGPPAFDCHESGFINNRRFLWKVRVNGVEYQPATPSTIKKAGKAMAATIALQSLGVIPKDSNVQVHG